MNARNVKYISAYNPRHLYPNVDNKLKTKKLAQKFNIAVPELLGTIQHQHTVKNLEKLINELPSFVIKPANGSTGKGILIIQKRDGIKFIQANGSPLSINELKRHVSNILSGLYSLGGKPDITMIEALVSFSPIFERYSYQGVPDIRVIVFKGYPVMAMLRLSTRHSNGKANLHQGAVGVGINIATGKAVKAVQFNRNIKRHPDTHASFEHLSIPHWRDLLELSASCYEITKLGYIGIDIVLDHVLGPLILELNARPGLAIQIANNAGLAPRLALIEEQTDKRDAADRAVFSVQAFR